MSLPPDHPEPESKGDPLVPVPVRVLGVRKETRDTFTLRLEPPARPGGFRFAPGQFDMLYVFGVGEVPISFSGDPARPEAIVHTVRAVGVVTAALRALKRGAVVGLRGPFGTPWPLEEARGKDLLIVAGGLGLAPLRPAILDALRRRGDHGAIEIVYGARTPEDLLFPKDLERWRGRLDTRVHVTVDRATPEWRGRVGIVTGVLPHVRVDPAQTVALVCGPEVMMRFVARELVDMGVPAARIHLSMERNMKCAIGFCGHCQLGPGFVCKDGPVYPLERIERLLSVKEV